MALTKREYVNDVTTITAENMNEIQDEIIRIGEAVDHGAFVGIHDVTTFAEYKAACDAGKACFMRYEDSIYTLVRVTDSKLWFNAADTASSMFGTVMLDSDDVYAYSETYIRGDLETSTHYRYIPTTEAVVAGIEEATGGIAESVANLESVVGLSPVIASGTAEAVAPAYTAVSIADGISLKKGETYTIKANATTDSTDFSVYVRLDKEDGTTIKQMVITHSTANYEDSFIYTADADYDNVRFCFKTSLTSGLSVTASLEIVKDIAVNNASHEDRLKVLEDVVGVSPVIASGTAGAIAPAYTRIVLADGVSIKKGASYTIKAKATTKNTDYAVYVALTDGSNRIGEQAYITHNSSNGEGTTTFIADADCDNLSLSFKTNLTSELAVSANLESSDIRNIAEKFEEVEEEVDAISDNFGELAEYVGLPVVIASGTAEAVAPAYTAVSIADGISLKKGTDYAIKGKAVTESTDYSVYVRLTDGSNRIGEQALITHNSANAEATAIFTADADYDNLSLAFLSNLASGLSVTASLETVGSGVLDRIDDSLSLYNPFAGKPIYHHLNQETTSLCNIPAQSLFDVNYAKALGFTMIEVNPHKCSDGVFVCKHGTSGNLGNGLKADDGLDYSGTAFSSVSSEWLRSHITYDTIDKYSGRIPTLEEVCAECKKLSMMIKVGSAEAVEVARKYLPDDMIWSTQNNRGDFRGLIEYVWYKTQTIDNCIAKCMQIGSPLNIVIAAGEFTDHTDAEIKELTQKAHTNGFTVGMVYPTSSDIVRALSLGVDVIGSVTNNINLFDVGDIMNIKHLNDTRLIFADGALYDAAEDVITMAANSTVGVSADNIASGKLSLRVRYSGSLTINDDLTYESDGTVTIPYAVVMQYKRGKTYDKWLTIKANSATTIYEMSLSCATV